jgi:hypothetical protein
MKNHIIRLGSVVKYGVGGHEASQLDIIYTWLLQEFEQDVYSHIGINQIGDDLDELIMKQPGNKIYINIRYPVQEDFDSKNAMEKNTIRLAVMHEALLRIAAHDGKLDVSKLEAIRDRVLIRHFSFDLVYKKVENKKSPGLTGNIIVHPQPDYFLISISIEEQGQVICSFPVFKGGPTYYYLDDLFFYLKWKEKDELIVYGKKKEVALHILVAEGKVDFVNLTTFEKPPFWEIMRADLPELDGKKAYENWLYSLPPAVASVVRGANN